MANEQNLKPYRSVSEARKGGALGGRASGEARRVKRDLRACLKALLDAGTDDGSTGAQALAVSLYSAAIGGDVKAIKVIAELTGQTRQTISFSLPGEVTNASDLPGMSAAVVKAVANGDLTPDEGGRIATLLAAHTRCVEDSDLEARIARLEEAYARADAAR